MRHPKTYGRLISVLSAVQLVLALSQNAQAAQEQKPAGVEQAKLAQTAFTYQGQLKDAIGPVNGVFDFQFTLYSAQTGGDMLGVSEIKEVTLTNGMFSFKLDFGRAAIEAKESWLEIGVRPSGSAEAYTILFPRQKLTPTPYAIFAQHEQWSLIGVPVGFADRALVEPEAVGIETDLDKQSKHQDKKTVVTPPEKTTEAVAAAGTANFIAKFDGAGNATANSIMFDNGTNVGIGTSAPSHRLSIAGGPVWTSNGWKGAVELENASAIAWQVNSEGLGFGLGHTNGVFSMFRTLSNPGTSQTPAIYDLAITDTGSVGVGTVNPTPGYRLDVTGNTRFDVGTPANNNGAITFGNPNAETGMTILRGTGRADLRFSGLTVKLLAGIAGGPPPNENGIAIDISGNVGIGTSSPSQKLDVRGHLTLDAGGDPIIYTSASSGERNRYVALINSSSTPSASGLKAGGILVADSYSYANPGKNDLIVKGRVGIGTAAPSADLEVNGTISSNGVTSFGPIYLRTSGFVGQTPLCHNAGGTSLGAISLCSSSLRYKTNVQPFLGGLDLVERLRPISFTWKQGGMHDIGLGAEEVEEVEPRLTFRNDGGEIEGVKYNQLSAVFINAFKEQQAQIAIQQQQITAQQNEIEELKRIVCATHPKAKACHR